VSLTSLDRPCEPDARATAPALRPSPAPYAVPARPDRAGVVLRPLEPGETEPVLEVFSGLGPRSRELRFLAAKPRLTAADLRQLTAVDHRDHVAVLALSAQDRRPVGVARFVRDPEDPTSADVAVAVVDAWQGRGVGTRLATALVERAREVGVRRFTLVMSRENEAAARLLHRVQGEVHRLDIGVETAEFAVDLDAAAPTRRRSATLKGPRP